MIDDALRAGNVVHVVNLTRGLRCSHVVALARPLRACRVQSTHCEQRRWADVVAGAGPDLLYALAVGIEVIVHDRSERDRETRACWQGLSWLRWACARAWRLPPRSETSRGGHRVDDYWDQAWRDLPRATRQALRYYRQFRSFDASDEIRLASCWEPER